MNYCEYCKEEIQYNAESCPQCGIRFFKDDFKSDKFICEICGSVNSRSDKKCKYCCSILTK